MQFELLSNEEIMNTDGGVALIGAIIIWGCCAVLGAATGAGIAAGYKSTEAANK